MKSWKTLFFEKAYIGRKTDLNNKDEIILACVKLAYRDMLSVGRFYLSNDMEEKCSRFVHIIKCNDFRFSRALIEDICELFGEEEIIMKGNRFVTRYGLSQKFVNMSYKYFYLYYDYVNEDIDFTHCDCPLDSIILSQLTGKKCVWSKLTKADYEICQYKITEELRKIELDEELRLLGNLAFDFIKW